MLEVVASALLGSSVVITITLFLVVAIAQNGVASVTMLVLSLEQFALLIIKIEFGGRGRD